jgi:phosphatidylinositol alpha-1,6-mannosyltransferase
MENLGGMQRVAVDLHESLARHPDVTLRTLVLRSGWNERGYRTPLFMAHALREIRRMARAREIDSILFSSMLTATLAVPLRGLLRRNKVVTAAIVNGLDATTPTWPYPLLVKRAFDALDLVMPISRATGEACRARGLPEAKSRVVSLGIRLDRFSPGAERSEARAKLTQGASPKLILCSVGRLVPRKGVAWFVANVMPLMPRDILYLVAGDGPDRGKVAAAIEQHDLGRTVKLLGSISDDELATLYQGSDLFVMPNVQVPNDMEGFGLVMLEAGLCGLPTIASNIEGIADVIGEGENGHLVPSRDAEAFRDAIMRYYSDPEGLDRARSLTRQVTSSRFGWDGVVDRYVSILQNLTS